MQAVLSWWLALEVLGVLAVPYLFVIFSRLPDRGLAFAKPFGLLAVAYLLWLAGSFHVLANGRGAAALVVVLLTVGALLLAARRRSEFIAFLQREKRTLILYEVAFLLAFLLWAFIRAYNPQIDATEKPMDFAMLNAASRARFFPPADPWLSGYPVNYYYFGYLNFAILTQLTGTAPAIGYNLALAFLFAATCVGAWGLVANLVALHHGDNGGQGGIPRPALVYGGLGAFFVVGLSNLEGLLEMVRAHGGGGPGFWSWISVKGLEQPYQSLTWYPSDGWWWWRATRVIDTVVDGRSLDYTITEFPFFSFMLGDLHPHVMALPFVLLAMGLALNTFLGQAPTLRGWASNASMSFLASVLILGSLGFINGWDLGPYLALFLGAAALRTWLDRPQWSWRTWLDYGAWALAITGGAILVYAPFYGPLAWQLLGALFAAPQEATVKGFPIAWWNGPGTRPLHFLLLWAPFMFISGSFLIALARRRAPHLLATAVGVLAGAVGVWVLIEVGLLLLPPEILAARPFGLLERTWFLGPLAVAGALLWHGRHKETTEDGAPRDVTSALQFVLLLSTGALVLLMVSESFRIKDVFGNRMNTVFKLYYQVWLLLACVSAFAVYYVRTYWRPSLKLPYLAPALWDGALVVLVAASSIYSVAAITSKTEAFKGPPTLDGMAYLKQTDPGEVEAMQWLSNQPRTQDAVILEATGNQYSRFGRVASNTGIPTVLGWAGHEVQWRGSDRVFRGRAEDVNQIYQTSDKRQVLPLLRKYDVNYVYVGSLEKGKYPGGALLAFEQALDVVFKNESVTIYQIRAGAGAG